MPDGEFGRVSSKKCDHPRFKECLKGGFGNWNSTQGYNPEADLTFKEEVAAGSLHCTKSSLRSPFYYLSPAAENKMGKSSQNVCIYIYICRELYMCVYIYIQGKKTLTMKKST